MQIQFIISKYSNTAIQVTSLRSNLYGMNRSSLFMIQLLSKELLQFKNEFIQATLLFSHQNHQQYHHGYIQQYDYLGKQNEWHCYKIFFDSIFFPIKLIQSNKTYINQKIDQVLKTIIESSMNPLHRIEYNLTKPQEINPIIIQYNQTDFDFFKTCIKRYHLFYNVLHSASHSKIYIFDDLMNPHEGFKPFDMYYVPKSKMMCDQARVFQLQLQYKKNEKYLILKSNSVLIRPGMVIKLNDYPVGSFNQLYRVLYISHHYHLEYYNRIIASPIDQLIRSNRYHFKSASMMTQAQIVSSDANYPEINQDGDYFLKFNFDQRQRISCPLKRLYPFNMHFGLRHGTEVAVGFINGDINQPVILGSLSSVLSPNVVSSKNITQNRMRTWGGHELVMDDAFDNQQIHLHTNSEKQSLLLSGKKQSHFVELNNRNGQVDLYAKQNIEMFIGGHQKILVQKNASIKVYDHYQLAIRESFHYQSGDNIYFTSNQSIFMQSKQDDMNLKSDVNISFNARNKLDITSAQSTFKIRADHGVLNFSGNGIRLIGKGKVICNAMSIHPSGIYFGEAALDAPIINIQPVMHLKQRLEEKGSNQDIIHQYAKHKNKRIQLYPLIALNLRPHESSRYFESDKQLFDAYKKSQLTAEEFSYFVHHGNNVTIFIHGYNVEYGIFGDLIQTDNDAELKRSVFRYQNVYRDRDLLQKQFPDAAINGEPVDASADLIINKKLNPTDQLLEIVRKPMTDHEYLLNGSGAHNWWLHMENNFNRATGQFDGMCYDKYERMLHIAWQGNPKCPLDYYADLSSAKLAAQKLCPVVEKFIAAGVQVNFVAHSLGNYVLMEALNHLPASSIDHVFMWQPAIPDYAFSKECFHYDYYFPRAVNTAKKIIVLYSRHDNILGPCDYHKSHFIHKSREAGIEMALMIKALDLLDHLSIPRHLLSVYNVANTFGCPFSDFFQGRQFRAHYYQQWIAGHHHIDGKPFETTLTNQVRFVRNHYLHSFNLISMAVAMSAYGIERVIDQYGNYLNQYLSNTFKNSKKMNVWNLVKAGKETAIKDVICNEVAAIIITVYISGGESPSPAMGYAGVRQKEAEILGSKLRLVDQSSWLYSHSGIRCPNFDLMENIYKKIIWKSNKKYRFGTYQH